MWPDTRVAGFVREHFIPARLHVKDQAGEYQRFSRQFGAPWTPTTLLLDPSGVERHRIEGFLPTDDFLSQLTVGLGHLAFTAERWDEAERWFREALERFPAADGAPEAQYWVGVTRYKKTNDAKHLAETAHAFSERYRDSTWAKKASVWTK